MKRLLTQRQFQRIEDLFQIWPQLLMFGNIQYFQKGAVYRLRNRKTRTCLTATYEVSTKPQEESSDQLWLLSEVKTGEYEIIHMRSGEVLTTADLKGQHLKLQRGRMKDSQLWLIDRAEIQADTNYFWIKPTKSNACLAASAMSEKIKLSNIDCTLQICLWQFISYPPTGSLLSGLSILRSEHSKLVIDVPEHSTKEGVALIQYSAHGGGNQRWTIEPYEKSTEGQKEWTIRNYCSGLHLTASFTKMGNRVTQTLFSCSPDQRWILQQAKPGVFHFQSVANSSYFLGVPNEKGGAQITLLQERDKSRWEIQGYYPAL